MWCIWCSARSPAPSCLPVLLSDCPRVAVWRRVILGGAAKTRGPVRQLLSEFAWRQGCRSRTKCRMVHLLRWVTHLNRRIISSVFDGYSTARVLWNGSPVSEGKQSLGVRVVVWRHAVDILSCRQTWSSLSPPGGFARHPPLPATLCKVCFFLRNAKMCLQAHSPPRWPGGGGEKKNQLLREE